MTAFHAISISKQFPDGDRLFSSISFSTEEGITALVGKNGSGKSHLAQILAKLTPPSEGRVEWGNQIRSVGFYSQLESESDLSQSIAQLLGVEKKLLALEYIQQGDSSCHWFDMIADDEWDLAEQLARLLTQLRLPTDLNIKLAQLSGGQRAVLRLYVLLQQDYDAFVLDEPTNHLDSEHVDWLVKQLKTIDKPVLVVSHNIAFLNHVDKILELNSIGITSYGGNYQTFVAHKNEHLQALQDKAKSLTRERKVKAEKAHQRLITAQKLATRGKAQRTSGSQPKILMDGKKQGAQNANAAIAAQSKRQFAVLDQKLQQVKDQIEQNKPQKWYTGVVQTQGKTAIAFDAFQHANVFGAPIRATVLTSEHAWLKGRNGSGKSTILKRVLAVSQNSSNVTEGLRANTQCFYLDQHFSMLNGDLALIDAVCEGCEEMTIPVARTLLAGIGFRRDKVYDKVEQLSGGEKMKLAMLIASHQKQVATLLLDEPDNHLDLEAKQQLIAAINGYAGTVLVVSHDMGFIEQLRIDKVIALTD
ncbi:ATP-binding cassette domain-containing protein [Vibrio mediterranei]|uniref:ATP-binding cassette domain-containing protein n=1 Tax=Vibrio mediterranei TaxID=689 RepID=UPI001EFDABC8|nr:ATP-binding cassette domain-containing protein [Vibrio mediterranei]MCG9628010.1 ATP-binding cassette domain-containing protein [Vibrio mediterranei]